MNMIQQIIDILHKKNKLAVGLMSGTSLDGIDAALVNIENSGTETKVKLIHFETIPYSPEERERILKLCSSSTSSVVEICKMNVELGKKLAHAALQVINQAGKEANEIDFISSHGQTIYHSPEHSSTFQIGELAVIAEETGCLTVGDFRPSDMAAGGQGAPLVPFVDYLLFSSKDKGRILLNIGGIGNLSVIKANAKPDEVIAFDTGPGNVLIDAIVHIGSHGQLPYDERGQLGSRGKICTEWLEKMLESDEYIFQLPPKSTGRELYTSELTQSLWNDGTSRGLAFEDIVATITAFTAHSIAINIIKHIDPHYSIEEIIVSGGGVHNKTLMSELQAQVKQKVVAMDELSFSSDAKEAIAFAILGNEYIHGQSNNLPSATGATKSVSMGKLICP